MQLMSPSEFQARLRDSEPGHWIFADPERFQSLPQAGGGIDCLELSVYGRMSEEGWGLIGDLLAVRDRCSDAGDAAQIECRARSLAFRGLQKCKGVTIGSPGDLSRDLWVNAKGAGVGRSFQPLLLREEGIVVRLGSRQSSEIESDSGKVTRVPLVFVEISGTAFLRLGEVEAMNRVRSLLFRLGVQEDRCRARRVDLCADLPGASIEEFRDLLQGGEYVTRCVDSIRHYQDPQRRCYTGFVLQSKGTLLRVYEKFIETDRDAEKRQLMVSHRWGPGVDKAVRVEFQFRLSEHKRVYNTLAELFAGIGELVAWATNVWFRLAVVGDDRSHSSRTEPCDCWLRAQHAFAWWASRLNTRPEPPKIQAAPPESLAAQLKGLLSSVVARTGVIPADEESVFAIAATWLPPGDLVRCVREKAAELATRGIAVPGRGGRDRLNGEIGGNYASRRGWSREQWREYGRGGGDLAFNG